MQISKSTFSTSFIVQKSKIKSNGRASILARITVNGKQAHFSTKLDIEPDRWLPGENQTVGFTPEERQTNVILDNFRALIRSRYYDMTFHGEGVSAARIKFSILGLEQCETGLLALFDNFNEDYAKIVGKETSHKTYSRYLLTRRRLSEFMASKYKAADIPVTAIDPKFVNDFFLYLRTTENNGHNYHMKHIQRLRTVFNVVRSNGWVQTDPFAGFKMRFEEVCRGYLTQDELDAFAIAPMPSKRLELIRDLFVFSCYCGLSYIDLKNLTWDNIVQDDGHYWIDTRRAKTNIPVAVRLLDVPLAIIMKHSEHSLDGPVFCVPDNQVINYALREIVSLCGIRKHITFHVARHSILSFSLKTSSLQKCFS